MVLHIIRNRHRLAKVRRLVQDGHDVNAYDKSGWTPLLRAAYHGDVEVARELIRANADVQLKVRGSGRSVLYTAAYYICQAWVKFYLLVMFILRVGEQVAGEVVRDKADYYGKNKGSGRTALHNAAYYGHQSLVKLFLETNININEQDDEGRTALMLAVERGHSAVVAELVKAGADISLKDKKGMTAVLLAKSYDMVGQLVRDVGDLSREDRSYILWHACDVGDLSMVQSVIEAGCDVNHIHKGKTPVMMATLRGHDSIVKKLILANCDVNLHSKGYYSDLASSLNVIRVHWPMAFIWLLMVYGAWIPCTLFITNFLFDALPMLGASMWLSFLLAPLLSVMIVVGVVLVPGSGFLMLVGSGVVGFAVFCVMCLLLETQPGISMVFAILMVVVLAVLYREFFMTVMPALASCVCAHVMFAFVKWSLGDVAMVEAVTVVAVVAVMYKVQNRIVAIGVLAIIEVYVVSVVCMKLGRRVLGKHKVAWSLVNPLSLLDPLSIGLLTVIPLLVVLGTQNTADCEVIIRVTVVLFGFQATRMLTMTNCLVPPQDVTCGLALVVLVLARIVAHIGATITKKSSIVKGVILMVVHLVVAVDEVYLTVVVFNKKLELWELAIVTGVFTNIVIIVMMTPFKAGNATALHYAAGHNRVKCGVLLVEAGGDMRAKNTRLYTPFDIGFSTFQTEAKQVLSFTTKHVIAVIGNSEHGKSTLVAALERTSDILWKKAIIHFKKVCDIRQRTAGIEAVQVSNPKYGEALFYDFAGQSQYHGPHQSFLEAMLSKPEASVTLLLLVKATEEEDIITQQLYRWLQPLALMSIPITPKVVVVGSFLDQVKSKKEASEKLLRCTQSVKTELALDIQGPCLLDCRQPESKGIDQICSFLQEAHPVNTNALSYNLHWVLVQVRKTFSIPALQLHEFQTWLQDNARNLPRNLPSPDEVCQDLSAAGHTLFLLNKQEPARSWLILDLPGLLYNVYGTLFSGSQDSVNMFGLLHCSQLNELFPKLCPEVIQGVLKSLEFCIEIDPALLGEDIIQLTTDEGAEGWLYFPALVSAQPSKDFPEDSDQNQFRWMCWQVRTAKKHFFSAHLLQIIILRLAANHVFAYKLSSSVRKHCCRVWVNGLSWRSTKGVDLAVQISDSSVVQVVGRSKAGSERLHRYTSTVVRDIIKTTTQVSPKLEATPYIVHPYTPMFWKNPKAAQSDSLYLVCSITHCISNGDDHVLSLPKEDGGHPQQMSLSEVFGWLPSLPVVQDMDFADPSSSSAGEWNAASVLPFQLASAPDNQKQLVVIAQTCIVY